VYFYKFADFVIKADLNIGSVRLDVCMTREIQLDHIISFSMLYTCNVVAV